MGFLDQKERVLDVVLTDLGRDLLSRNQLNFTYYAFSDEGIDYSGSLSSSTMLSSTLDNYIHKQMAFEADQRIDQDLRSFLYTIPPDRQVLPEFKISANLTSSTTLERQYTINTMILQQNKPTKTVNQPVDVVIRATIPKENLIIRTKKYVLDQKTTRLINILQNRKLLK